MNPNRTLQQPTQTIHSEREVSCFKINKQFVNTRMHTNKPMSYLLTKYHCCANFGSVGSL